MLLAKMRYVITVIGLFAWAANLLGFSFLNGMNGEFVRPMIRMYRLIGLAAVPLVLLVWFAHWQVTRMAIKPKVRTAWMVWQILMSLAVLTCMLFFLGSI